jgi:predicted small lipoprotein YifL
MAMRATLLALALGAVALAGCGIKGPLYLPPAAHTPAPAHPAAGPAPGADDIKPDPLENPPQ